MQSAVTADDAISHIEQRGYAHIRNVLSKDVAKRYAAATERAIDAAARLHEGQYKYTYQVTTAASDIREYNDILGGNLDILKLLFTPLLRAVHTHFLRPGFRVCLQKSRIRLQYGNIRRPAHHELHKWHQDAGLGYVPGPMINIWVALTDCGISAPSLELVP